jgi:hypothetical protein
MQEIAAIELEKYKNFLGENTPRPPPTLNAIPHQTFCYQQTINHFSTLGIVWSLFVDGPPTDEFLKNALQNGNISGPVAVLLSLDSISRTYLSEIWGISTPCAIIISLGGI